MNTIDLTPLYRNSIGFDRFGTLLDKALGSKQTAPGYPPYDIEVHDENQYTITLVVAGFDRSELDIQLDNGVLTVRGEKCNDGEQSKYIYQGITNRTFERKFNLADYVEVTKANLERGLLTINLMREIPEEMKPKSITIGITDQAIDQPPENQKPA